MDDSYKPTSEVTPAYEDLGPTRPSTFGREQSTKSLPPANIRKLIGELGFRYRPSAQADLQAHGARLLLLAADVADIPEKLLRTAIEDWARRERFMPTAAELIHLAKAHAIPGSRKPDTDRAKLVAMLPEINRRSELQNAEWAVDAGGSFYIKDL